MRQNELSIVDNQILLIILSHKNTIIINLLHVNNLL